MVSTLFMNQFHQARKVVLYCLCAIVLVLMSWASPIRAQQAYPDLVAISVTGPTNSGPGQPVSVTFTIVNQGSGDAADFQVGLYLSADAAIATSDILLGKVDVCGLHAGATLTVPATLAVPQNVPNGDYFLGAIANVSGALVEADMTNNSVASNQKINISNAPHPVITSISGPLSAFTDGTATFSVTVLNSGFSVGYYTRVAMYLSLTPEITSSSIHMGEAVAPAPYYANGLAPGQSTTITFAATIPGISATSYYVLAKADLMIYAPGAVHYTNTAFSSQKLEVIGPGLQVTNVSGPQAGYTGGSIAVSNTVITKGAYIGTAPEDRYCPCYPARIMVRICLFQADRTTVYSCLLTRNAGYLGAGGTSTDTTMVTIPANTPPGTYYLGAIAYANIWDDNFPDEVDTVAESTLVSTDPITIQHP